MRKNTAWYQFSAAVLAGMGVSGFLYALHVHPSPWVCGIIGGVIGAVAGLFVSPDAN